VVTVNDVLDLVAAVLHLSGGRAALAAGWDTLARRGLEDATADVHGTLAAQGLGGGLIAAWSGYDSAVRRLAAYWALVYGGSMLPTPVNETDLKTLDIREWLKTATLTDSNGRLLKPDPLADVAGRGTIRGSFRDAAARDPRRRTGFLDAATGTLRRW
jgi:hypothetical protein